MSVEVRGLGEHLYQRWELLADWSSGLKGSGWAASGTLRDKRTVTKTHSGSAWRETHGRAGDRERRWAVKLVASRNCWPFMFRVCEFVFGVNERCCKATVLSLAVGRHCGNWQWHMATPCLWVSLRQLSHCLFKPEDQSANSPHLCWLVLWYRWRCSPSPPPPSPQ